MTYKPITLTDQFNILNCTISLTVSLSQLTLEADPNKIPHKICFNMSKQNQIKDFPQNSRKVKRVVSSSSSSRSVIILGRQLGRH